MEDQKKKKLDVTALGSEKCLSLQIEGKKMKEFIVFKQKEKMAIF